MHNLLDNIKFVINESNSITISSKNIKKFCISNPIETDVHWLDKSPQNIRNLTFQEQLNFFILLDTISYCFWKLPKWKIRYRNKYLDGSWGMVAALAKAIERGMPILDFKYLKELSLNKFNDIVEDKSNLVFKEQRVKNINEVANVIVNQFDSDIINLLNKVNYDAIMLIDYILTFSPSFNDVANFKTKTIRFYKKAQLLVSDINYVLEINGRRSLSNIDKITACADYKIPFILREHGILVYGDYLSSLVDNRVTIEKGSIPEVEIRSFAIWAIELIKNEYEKHSIHINSKQINDYLWLQSQIKNKSQKPYHLTITSYY